MISTPENLLVEISGALGVKESHYLNEIVYFSVQYPLISDEGGRSAKFELTLTTRCQFWGGRSAKFELILTTRCQIWGVGLPNLNSS